MSLPFFFFCLGRGDDVEMDQRYPIFQLSIYISVLWVILQRSEVLQVYKASVY